MAQVPLSPLDLGGDARSALVDPSVPFRRLETLRLSPALMPVLKAAQARAKADEVARDSITSVALEGEFEKRTTEEIAKLDPIETGYLDKVDEILTTTRDDVLRADAFETQAGVDIAQGRLDAKVINRSLAATGTRRTALEKDALRLREVEVDRTLARIRAAPEMADALIEEFGSKMRRLAPTISPDIVRALAENFGDQALFAEAEGLALQGKTSSARALVDEHQEDLSPAQFRSAKNRIREIEGQQRADFARATDRTIADFEIGIVKGEFDTLADIEEFEKRNPGIYTGREGKRVQHARAIEAGRRARIKSERDLTIARTNAELGRGLDTERQADALWQDTMKSLRGAPPAEVMEHVTNFAENTGWVPPRMAQDFANAERTENPDLLGAVALQHDMIRRTAPNAQGMDSAGDRVALTQSIVELTGSSYDDAAKQVIAGVPDPVTLKLRRQEFDEQLDALDIEDKAASFGERTLGETADIFGLFTTEPTPSGQAIATYERTLGMFYDLHGDMEVAERATERLMSQRFGRTNVGGVNQVAELPPERFLPAPGQALETASRTQLIETEITQFLTDFGIETTPAIGDDEGLLPRFSLVVDNQTRREFNAHLPPTYVLHVRSPTGALVPVPTWVDGRTGAQLTPDERRDVPRQFQTIENLRYSLPTATELVESPLYQEAIQEQETGLRERRDVTEQEQKALIEQVEGMKRQAQGLRRSRDELVEDARSR